MIFNPDTTSFSKETYGFKSTKNPPPIEELKDFEDDMLKMVQSVKFKQVNSPFLNKLKEDTDRIKNEPKLLIAADKIGVLSGADIQKSRSSDIVMLAGKYGILDKKLAGN